MILTRIVLRNFRSYDALDLTFGKGLTIIEGENAVGKTNLAEAISYISLARSWRTSDEEVLVKAGSSEASIQAFVKEGYLSREIRIELGKSGKKIFINGKPAKRLSELSSLVNVITFSPMDVALFVASPSERRSFLDISLSKRSSDYFSLIAKYNRLLKERNALLKQPNPDLGLLDVITEQIIEVVEPLDNYRALYVASINEVLPGVLGKLRGVKTDCSLVYRPFVKTDERFKERAQKAYSEAKQSDLIHRSTGVGPHREDISFLLNGKDISDYGSQGENRMAVLALKLCPYFLIEDEDKKPICVLDDVNSELDAAHAGQLFELLKGFSQVFVTTTKLNLDGASYIDVTTNNATRRI